MILAKSIHDLPQGLPTTSGFVPTMGALHDGHLELMRQAKQECGYCIASVFVNPTQFGPNEDFNRYPRTLDRDLELAESVGVDLVFAPTAEEMYPGSFTTIRVETITECFEGASRPGHFDGVATVVAKLFHIVRATDAYFGQKDLQQCAVIDRMVRDLNIPIQLHFLPTVRESDGLAMSSRNRYLSAEHRKIAPKLYQELQSAKEAILSGDDIAETLNDCRIRICDAGFAIDYYELVDLENWRNTNVMSQKSAIVTAAKIGDTRLIDNIIVTGSL